MHTDALHAGVNLQVHDRLALHGGGLRVDGVELVDRGGGERQVVLDEEGDLLAEDAAEHQDRQLHAVLAQAQPFLQVGHANHRRAVLFERACHLDQTVAVRVRLEDRHHLRAADEARDGVVVLGEHVQIHLEPRGAQLAGGDGRLVQHAHGRWRSTGSRPRNEAGVHGANRRARRGPQPCASGGGPAASAWSAPSTKERSAYIWSLPRPWP